MGLQFRILGPLEAVADGVPATLGGPRQRAVLAILLAHDNEAAENIVKGYVSALRKALGRDVIGTRGRGYAVTVADVTGCQQAPHTRASPSKRAQ